MKKFYFAYDSELGGVIADLRRHGHVVTQQRSSDWTDLIMVDGVKRGAASIGMYYGHEMWLDEELVAGRMFDFRRSRELLETEVHIINNRLWDKSGLDVSLIPEVERLYQIFVERGFKRVGRQSGQIFWLETAFPVRGRPNNEYVE